MTPSTEDQILKQLMDIDVRLAGMESDIAELIEDQKETGDEIRELRRELPESIDALRDGAELYVDGKISRHESQFHRPA